MPKSTSVICAVDNEENTKREHIVARHPNYESLSVTAPAVAAHKTDLTASKFSPQNQPTSSCLSANTLKGDQVFFGESTNRKVAMQ